MRVIVTGGAGFLGRLLIQGLQADGVDDIVVIEIAEADVPGCRIIQGDLANDEILLALIAEGPSSFI